MYNFSLIYNIPFLNRMDLRITKGLFSLFVKDLGGKRSILAMSTTAGAILGGVGITIAGASSIAVLGGITSPIYQYFYPDNLEVADAKIPVETPANSADAELPAETPTTSAFLSPLVDEPAPAKEEKSVNSDQHPAPLLVSASPLISLKRN